MIFEKLIGRKQKRLRFHLRNAKIVRHNHLFVYKLPALIVYNLPLQYFDDAVKNDMVYQVSRNMRLLEIDENGESFRMWVSGLKLDD